MRRALFFAGMMTLVFTSCDKAKNPNNINSAETITTVKLNFTEQGNPSNTFTVQYSDPDGIGGNPPSIDTLYLENGKTYEVTAEFWNEAVTPSEDLTIEIATESAEHFLCYEIISGLNIAFTYNDTDANALPIGLSTTWTVNGFGNGDFQLSLKHQPDGLKDGTCAPGETDAETIFPVVVN